MGNLSDATTVVSGVTCTSTSHGRVVGDLVAENEGYASTIFDALKGIPIRMISYGGSNYNLSLLINAKDKKEALNLLSNKLFN